LVISVYKKVLCIIGTRPEVIKMAPVIRALRAAPELAVSVLNSGQHRELLAPLMRVAWALCRRRGGRRIYRWTIN
jgi:UDP-N-acetylglucosamine 2-epimerase (non-hydrolysing)